MQLDSRKHVSGNTGAIHMNGFEVLGLLKQHPETADIPVIAVTARAMPHDIEAGKAAGFVDYLTKPLNVPQFLRSIDRYLR